MSDIDAAVEALLAGRAVVIPTDTVYGIAVIPSDQDAVASVFKIKGRSRDKGLPVLVASVEQLEGIVVPNPRAKALAKRFWPGPLTMILPAAKGFDADLGGLGDGTVAVRVPALDITRELLEKTGPLAVTSANLSGVWAATTVAEARAAVGHAIDVFLDAGKCDGATSTIVSLVGETKKLRKGPITDEDIEDALGGADPGAEKIDLF